jgi:kinesin family protein 2/24
MMDRHFQLDAVFEEHASNVDVYSGTLAPLIKQIKTGFNVTCFAYGMTGAGKTHTMFGQRGEPGIANLVMKDLFMAQDSEVDELSMQSKVTVSFLEIYNEQVKDLLSEQ